MSGKVDFTTEGKIAHLRLDNPEKKNAISAEMWADLREIANQISMDHSIRVTILQGTGSAAFAAGADISQFEAKRSASTQGSTYDDLIEGAITAIKGIPIPVIAAIRGYCIGGGVSLALGCDIRVAAGDAKFAVPPAKLGTAYPHPAIKRLTRQIGPSNSKYLLFTGQRIDSHVAKQMNLIDLIFDNDNFDDQLGELTNSILNNAPLSIKSSKYSVDQFADIDKEPNLDQIFLLAKQCFSSNDYKEGVKAFMESRKPNFTGE